MSDLGPMVEGRKRTGDPLPLVATARSSQPRLSPNGPVDREAGTGPKGNKAVASGP